MNGSEPAFPVNDLNACKWPGLTKRQWLAGMALQGLCANPAEDVKNQTYDKVAEMALKHADALIAAEGGGK